MSDGSNRGRRTLYRGVPMRSRLEASVAAWLDSHEIVWQYEPVCFADQTGQYLPDFKLTGLRVCGRNDAVVYLEVKPLNLGDPNLFANRDTTMDDCWALASRVMHRMECIWSSEPDAFLALASPNDVAYHSFPLYSTAGNSMHARWIVCEACGTTGIDTDGRLSGPFSYAGIPAAEPWRCPTCRVNAGFTTDTPWFGQSYQRLLHGVA